MKKLPAKTAVAKPATGKKCNGKTSPVSTAEPQPLKWKRYVWYSTGRNWRAEYRKRIETKNFNPFVNPASGEYYSVQAQNYRSKYIIIREKNQDGIHD
jgi:hypothetical protein